MVYKWVKGIFRSGRAASRIYKIKSDDCLIICYRSHENIVMPPDFDHTGAYGIAVSGSDVYLVGDAWNNTGRSQAILWKNRTAIPLTDGSLFAMATGIFIQGSDAQKRTGGDNSRHEECAAYSNRIGQ